MFSSNLILVAGCNIIIIPGAVRIACSEEVNTECTPLDIASLHISGQISKASQLDPYI